MNFLFLLFSLNSFAITEYLYDCGPLGQIGFSEGIDGVCDEYTELGCWNLRSDQVLGTNSLVLVSYPESTRERTCKLISKTTY